MKIRGCPPNGGRTARSSSNCRSSGTRSSAATISAPAAGDASSSLSKSAAMRPAGPRHAASPASACAAPASRPAQSESAIGPDARPSSATKRGRIVRHSRKPPSVPSRPARPAGGRGPRSFKSTARTASSQASRSSPSPPTSGCLATASSGDRRKLLGRCGGKTEQKRSWRGFPTMAARRCRRLRLPKPRASAETRAASCRSGVTSAAVLPGVSTASRSARAIAWASPAACGSSARRTPVRRRSRSAPALSHLSREVRARSLHWRPPAPAIGDDAAPPACATAAPPRARRRSGRAAA